MIECSEVSFSFPGARSSRLIFDRMNVSFAEGKFHAVMGPSGSGKTTLLNLLDATLRPHSGSITIAGKEVGAYQLGELRGHILTRIYQDYRLIPFLTAADNIRLAQQVAGNLKSKPDCALDLLQRLGIYDLADYPASQLSGGEAQRVAIARALANYPKVILADEPTGALDEKASLEIAVLLRNLAHETGVCIVTVTHDPALAAAADRVVLVHDYQMVEKNLSTSPQGSF
ncbi:ABC transporter ATP-binding protein [Boudabousia marimammalium]|uniref:ABC transporter domain-containing protein n=1 Tax=Boudabousia marimammalium TaxID=156892 RepID=A0A1Q5PSR8_9ACTO|nr:ABC transporter ATP-binding protein [Boudabousia marimammalium]OKL50492.1 hypothetical protein BM477_00515 [Boudabousia marimammalium]